MTELFRWSATEVLDGFASKRLSPVEYLDALTHRIAVTQPVVNALGDTYLAETRDAARAAGERWAGRGKPPRPLEGLPVVVKDETEVAGRRTTNGSLLWADSVSERSDPIVERLEAAGAIVIGRGLTPEFSVPFWTHSRMWGVTRNPWNPAYDVGGSSGGSAAAIAAGMVPVATGSDIGGSIRVPASCCGVVGYLPPSGRIPVPGVWGRDDWSKVGPITRTVADCALVLDQVSGPDSRDHFSLRDGVRIGVPDGDVRGLRVALSVDLGDWPVTDEVSRAVLEAADTLRAAGADVQEVALTVERDLVRRASNSHNAALFGASLEVEIADRRDLVNDYVLAWLAELAEFQSPATFFEGRQIEAEISQRVDAVLADHDVLLCPAMCVPALAAGVDYTQTPLVVDGVERDSFHDIHLTEVFNVANRCPVLTVPAGRSSAGVPIGVQVVGRTYDDPMVFRVGAALEAARPWQVVASLPDASREG